MYLPTTKASNCRANWGQPFSPSSTLYQIIHVPMTGVSRAKEAEIRDYNLPIRIFTWQLDIARIRKAALALKQRATLWPCVVFLEKFSSMFLWVFVYLVLIEMVKIKEKYKIRDNVSQQKQMLVQCTPTAYFTTICCYTLCTPLPEINYSKNNNCVIDSGYRKPNEFWSFTMIIPNRYTKMLISFNR